MIASTRILGSACLNWISVLLFLVSPAIPGAQPTNDMFTAAEPIVGMSGSLIGTNDLATSEPDEPIHSGIPGGNSVWYTWTAPSDGCLVISSDGSDFDTVVAVYTGNSVDNLSPVAGNDDDGATSTSRLMFAAQNGIDYRIAIDGKAGTTGTIHLAWFNNTPAAPMNPLPADGAVTTFGVTLLDWDDVTSASQYEAFLDGTSLGVVTNSEIQLSSPSNVGIHTWRVDAANDCTTVTGVTWQFEYCPDVGMATNPSPANGETTFTPFSRLDWDDALSATLYDVWIDGELAMTVADSEATVSLLAGNHLWAVNSRNSCRETPGPGWRFKLCNPLASASEILSPAANETTNSRLLFTWTPIENAKIYTLLVDGIEITTVPANLGGLLVTNSTIEFTPGTTQTLTSIATTTSALVFPLPAGPHVCQMLVKNDCLSHAGTIVPFCVVPVPQAIRPRPGFTDCESPTELTWTTSSGTLRYDVYIDGTHVGDTTETKWVLNPPLEVGGHRWSLTMTGTCGVLSGPEWPFKIERQPSANSSWYNPNGPVYAMVATSDTLYLGGNFTQLVCPGSTVTVARRNIAAINLQNGAPTDWNPGANSVVRTIAVDGSDIYIGGDFDMVGGKVHNRLAHIKDTGLVDEVFKPSMNGAVLALATHGGTVFAGGAFTSVNGIPRTYIAALERVTGDPFEQWKVALNYHVSCITIRNSEVFIGGSFSNVQGKNQQGIARVTLDNAELVKWNPEVDHYVHAMEFPTTTETVIIGGYFSKAGGFERENLAELDLETTAATSWNPVVNGSVTCLEIQDNGIYVGGVFSNAGDVNHPYIARFNLQSGDPAACIFAVDNEVRCLATTPNGVALGGTFTNGSIGGFVFFGGTEFPAEVNDWSIY